MPSLVRFLTIIAIFVALVYAAMYALVASVTPRQTEMSEEVVIPPRPAPTPTSTPQPPAVEPTPQTPQP